MMLNERVSFTSLYTCFTCKVGKSTACTFEFFVCLFVWLSNGRGIVLKGTYCLTCGTYIYEKVRVRTTSPRHLLSSHVLVLIILSSVIYFTLFIFHNFLEFAIGFHCPDFFRLSFLLCFFVSLETSSF